MKYCPNCGTAVADESAFCTECGAALSQIGAQTAAPEHTQTGFDQVQPAPVTAPVTTTTVNTVNYVPAPETFEQPQQQEEKVSAGLIVLSVFFPIVGFILFFANKKKKPKTAKICGIAAGIVLVLHLAVFGVLTVIAVKNLSKQQEQEPQPRTLNTEIYGGIQGDTYENTFFGIGYKINKNYYFMKREKMKELSSAYSESPEDPGLLQVVEDNTIYFYDSRVEHETLQCFFTTRQITTTDEFGSKKDVLDYFISDTSEWVAERKSQIYEKTIGGQQFSCCNAYYKGAENNYEHYYYTVCVTEKDGQFFLAEFFNYESDDSKIFEEMQDFFYSLDS